MKLAAVISITAGGPGSGPNSPCPQCGPTPKAGGDGTRDVRVRDVSQIAEGGRIRGPKGLPAVNSPRTDPPAIIVPKGRAHVEETGKTMPGRRGQTTPTDIVRRHAQEIDPQKGRNSKAVNKMYREYRKETLTPTKKTLEDWRSKVGEWKGLSPEDLHKLRTTEPGDKGLTSQKMKAFDERIGSMRTYKAGTPVTITGVIPPVAGNPPLFSVKFPGGGTLHAPLDNIYVDKRIAGPKIDVKDVSRRDTIVRSTTADGAKYTVVKPATIKDDQPFRTREHGLKGSFQSVTGVVKGIDDPTRRSAVFFAQPKNAPPPDWIRDDKGSLRQLASAGTTVFVHRYQGDNKRATVQEVNTGPHGYRFQMSRTWQYKNLGAADNFLSKRYGIRFRLKDLKGAALIYTEVL